MEIAVEAPAEGVLVSPCVQPQSTLSAVSLGRGSVQRGSVSIHSDRRLSRSSVPDPANPRKGGATRRAADKLERAQRLYEERSRGVRLQIEWLEQGAPQEGPSESPTAVESAEERAAARSAAKKRATSVARAALSGLMLAKSPKLPMAQHPDTVTLPGSGVELPKKHKRMKKAGRRESSARLSSVLRRLRAETDGDSGGSVVDLSHAGPLVSSDIAVLSEIVSLRLDANTLDLTGSPLANAEAGALLANVAQRSQHLVSVIGCEGLDGSGGWLKRLHMHLEANASALRHEVERVKQRRIKDAFESWLHRRSAARDQVVSDEATARAAAGEVERTCKAALRVQLRDDMKRILAAAEARWRAELLRQGVISLESEEAEGRAALMEFLDQQLLVLFCSGETELRGPVAVGERSARAWLEKLAMRSWGDSMVRFRERRAREWRQQQVVSGAERELREGVEDSEVAAWEDLVALEAVRYEAVLKLEAQRRVFYGEEAEARVGEEAQEAEGWGLVIDMWNFHAARTAANHERERIEQEHLEGSARSSIQKTNDFVRTVLLGLCEATTAIISLLEAPSDVEQQASAPVNAACILHMDGDTTSPPPRLFCSDDPGADGTPREFTVSRPVAVDDTISLRGDVPPRWADEYSAAQRRADARQERGLTSLRAKKQLRDLHSDHLKQLGYLQAAVLLEVDERERTLQAQVKAFRRYPDASRVAEMKQTCWGGSVVCWVEAGPTPINRATVAAKAAAAESLLLCDREKKLQREPGTDVRVWRGPLHSEGGPVSEFNELLRSTLYHSYLRPEELRGWLERRVTLRVEVLMPLISPSDPWLWNPRGPPQRFVTATVERQFPVLLVMPFVSVPRAVQDLVYGGTGSKPGQELALLKSAGINDVPRVARGGDGGVEVDTALPTDFNGGSILLEIPRGYTVHDHIMFKESRDSLTGFQVDERTGEILSAGERVAVAVVGQLKKQVPAGDSPQCPRLLLRLADRGCTGDILRRLLRTIRFVNARPDPLLGTRELLFTLTPAQGGSSRIMLTVDVQFADVPAELILQQSRWLYHQILQQGWTEETRRFILKEAKNSCVRMFDNCKLFDPDTDRFVGGYLKVSIGTGYQRNDRIIVSPQPDSGVSIETADALMGVRWIAFEGRRVGRLFVTQMSRPGMGASRLSRLVRAAQQRPSEGEISPAPDPLPPGARLAAAKLARRSRVDVGGEETEPGSTRSLKLDSQPPVSPADEVTPATTTDRGPRSTTSTKPRKSAFADRKPSQTPPPSTLPARSPRLSVTAFPETPAPVAEESKSGTASAGSRPLLRLLRPTVKVEDNDSPGEKEGDSSSPAARKLSHSICQVVARVAKSRAESVANEQDLSFVRECKIEFTKDGNASILAVQALLRSLLFDTSQPDGFREGVRYIDCVLQLGPSAMKETVDGTVRAVREEDMKDMGDPIREQVAIKVLPPLLTIPGAKERRMKYQEGAGPQKMALFDLHSETDAWDGGWIKAQIVSGYDEDEDQLSIGETGGITLRRRERDPADELPAASAPTGPQDSPPAQPTEVPGKLRSLLNRRGQPAPVQAPSVTPAPSGVLSPSAAMAVSQAQTTSSVRSVASQLTKELQAQRQRDKARGIDDKWMVGDVTYDICMDSRDLGVVAVTKDTLSVAFPRRGDVRRKDVLLVLRNLMYANVSSVPSSSLRYITVTAGCPIVGTTGPVLVVVEVQEVDDVTAVHLLDSRIMYRPCPADATTPLCVAGLDRAFLEDPDTLYFDGGHLAVDLVGGGAKGDSIDVLTYEQQKRVLRLGGGQPPPPPPSALAKRLSRMVTGSDARLGVLPGPARRLSSMRRLSAKPPGQDKEDKDGEEKEKEREKDGDSGRASPAVSKGPQERVIPKEHAALAIDTVSDYMFSVDAPEGRLRLVRYRPGTDLHNKPFAYLSFPKAKGLNVGSDLLVSFLRHEDGKPGLVPLKLAQYVMNCITFVNRDERLRHGQRSYQVRIGDGSNPSEGKARFTIDVAPPLITAGPGSTAYKIEGSVPPEGTGPVCPRISVNCLDGQVLDAGFASITISAMNGHSLAPGTDAGQLAMDLKVVGGSVKDGCLYSTAGPIATVQAWSADLIRLEFSASAKCTAKQLQSLLRSLTLSVKDDGSPGFGGLLPTRQVTIAASMAADGSRMNECVAVLTIKAAGAKAPQGSTVPSLVVDDLPEPGQAPTRAKKEGLQPLKPLKGPRAPGSPGQPDRRQSRSKQRSPRGSPRSPRVSPFDSAERQRRRSRAGQKSPRGSLGSPRGSPKTPSGNLKA